MEDLFAQIVDWYMANMNYWTITLLMAIESSFIPFPSETIIPPAAFKAANGELYRGGACDCLEKSAEDWSPLFLIRHNDPPCTNTDSTISSSGSLRP